MPEVIIIDEIGTELEAMAARTIAERGVQLVGTAHGNTLDNLIMNPTLSDLVGGIQSVTLGDEEAKRRGTQKSILERKSPPTFNIVVEIQDRERVAIHPDVGEAVDAILRGQPLTTEVRWLDENGEVKTTSKVPSVLKKATKTRQKTSPPTDNKYRLALFGVNRLRLEQIAKDMKLDLDIVENLNDANLFVTSKNFYRRRPQKVRDAEAGDIPIYVLRSNTPLQIRQFLNSTYPAQGSDKTDALQDAIGEAEEAIEKVRAGQGVVKLHPQSAYIRRLQHLVAQRNELASQSLGKGIERRVTIFRR